MILIMARAVHPNRNEVSQRILVVLGRKKKCDLDDLIQDCPSYSWAEVFLEVDRMSRNAEVCLFSKKAGDYTVSLRRAA
jgi:hypothetical protein